MVSCVVRRYSRNAGGPSGIQRISTFERREQKAESAHRSFDLNTAEFPSLNRACHSQRLEMDLDMHSKEDRICGRVRE